MYNSVISEFEKKRESCLYVQTCAGALHLCEEFLFDGVHELGTKVSGVQHYLMVQRDVIEHGAETWSNKNIAINLYQPVLLIEFGSGHDIQLPRIHFLPGLITYKYNNNNNNKN